MTRTSLAFLFLSYALVCWRSADAIAPLAVFIPYVTIAGVADGRVFAPEVLASLLGLVGGLIGCVAEVKKEKKALIASIVLLGISATWFIVTSVPWMFSACTAVPFVVCAIICLRQRVIPA